MLTDPGASASLFATHFWGDKFNGFDVMYHNMKHGQKCSNEFLEMLRESCSIEETYHKSLTKLAKQIGGYSSSGTYVPLWTLLRQSIERLAVIHFELMQKWQTVSKDVLRYMDEQQKRQKAIKEAEGGTLEVVQSIQVTSVALLKAKDVYHSRYADYEKTKRNDSASVKDLDKTESKLKKAQDEYKYLIEKYNNNRNDFQKKMINSCRHFQEVEERHLDQMRDYLRRYAQGWSMVHAELGKVYSEFEQAMEEATPARLLQKFVEERGTGREVPQPVIYEEAEVAAAFPPSTTNEIYGELPPPITPMATGGDQISRKASIGDLLDRISNYSDRSADAVSGGLNAAPPPSAATTKKKEGASGGFFRRRRNSMGEKSGKKKNSKSSTNLAQEAAGSSSAGIGAKDGQAGGISRQPAVDDEGYSIPPVNPWVEPKGDSSSSEEEEDQDDRFRAPKITIKPRDEAAAPTEGNLDAIKATMELIRIASPTGNLGRRTPTAALTGVRKSTSVSDQLVAIGGMDRTNVPGAMSPASRCSDLLGLDIDDAPAPPTERARSALPNHPRPPSRARPRPRPETPDLLGGGGGSGIGHAVMSPWASFDVPPSTVNTQPPPLVPIGNSSSSSSSSAAVTASSAFTSMARGPSPAPLLSSEPVPIAVAFTETVLLHQKGSSIDSFQMKVQGELAFAFPAGILRHLNNEFGAGLSPLVFTLSKTEKLLKYQINDKLTQADADSTDVVLNNTAEHQIRINMAALGSHLRNLRDNNPAATYFNVTVLRYELSEGSCRPPLLLAVHWRREATALAYRIDFKTGWPLSRPEVSTPAPSVRLACPMEGAIAEMLSKPDGTWTKEKRLATWVVPAAQLSAAVDPSGSDGGGTIRARFNLATAQPPAQPGSLSAQFLCEGASLSGMEMALQGAGYRISLNKRRLISGKMYACDAGEEERQLGFLPNF